MKRLPIALCLALSVSPALAMSRSQSVAIANAYKFTPSVQKHFTQLAVSACSTPSGAWKRVVANAIFGWIGAGAFSTSDAIYFLGAPDACGAKINAANPGNNTLVLTGTVTFTPYVGFTGDGTTGFYSMASAVNALTNFTQNNGHLGAWVSTLGSQGAVLGESLSPNSAALGVTAASHASRINNTTAFNDASGFVTGYASADRNGSSTVINTFSNGAALTVGASQASAAPSTQVLTLFHSSAASFGNGTLCEADIGAGMTAGQEATITNAALKPLCGTGAVPH